MCHEKKEKEDLKIEDSIDTSIRRLEDCVKKEKERLIIATRNNKHQQNNINQKTEIGRKVSIRIF